MCTRYTHARIHTDDVYASASDNHVHSTATTHSTATFKAIETRRPNDGNQEDIKQNHGGASDDVRGGMSSPEIVGVVVGILAAVMAVAVLVVAARRWQSRTRGPTMERHTIELHTLLLKRVQAEFLLGYRQLIAGKVRSFDDYQTQIDLLAVKPSCVKLHGAEIGRGNYGAVYRAELRRPRMPAVTVAVKIPAAALAASESETAKIERSAALLLEAFVLHGLQHPRIVTLLAICTHVRPIMVCMEYMARGDLRTFLRKCRPALQAPAATVDHITMAVIGSRMSAALSFLERKRVIHRDIAARNVLVGEDITDVKLSDLGAARNVKSKEDYTYVATTDHMPWRWMPLEALRDASFSHKSDVFGFGVLIWEIGTLGRPPWGAFGVADVVAGLKNGERLQRPPDSPDQLHELCLRCWAHVPADRPSFAQINDELQILPAILRNTVRASGEFYNTHVSHSGQAFRDGDASRGGYERFREADAHRGHERHAAGYVDEPIMEVKPVQGHDARSTTIADIAVNATHGQGSQEYRAASTVSSSSSPPAVHNPVATTTDDPDGLQNCTALQSVDGAIRDDHSNRPQPTSHSQANRVVPSTAPQSERKTPQRGQHALVCRGFADGANGTGGPVSDTSV